MICGATWLQSRVLVNGEISTDGNERVYPGGESFFGEPKQVAWVDAVRALLDSATVTRNSGYRESAMQIARYYDS
jgi:hypothetical protein